MIKFTITNDELVQRPGYTPNGKYDEIFAQLTPEQNCIVLEDAKDLNRVSGALIDYAKRRKIVGAKVKTTKAYHTDGKPRLWLVFPPEVKTTIRGNFPKS